MRGEPGAGNGGKIPARRLTGENLKSGAHGGPKAVDQTDIQSAIERRTPANGKLIETGPRRGAAEFGWDKRHKTGDPASGPIKTGMGVAINTWAGHAPGIVANGGFELGSVGWKLGSGAEVVAGNEPFCS